MPPYSRDSGSGTHHIDVYKTTPETRVPLFNQDSSCCSKDVHQPERFHRTGQHKYIRYRALTHTYSTLQLSHIDLNSLISELEGDALHYTGNYTISRPLTTQARLLAHTETNYCPFLHPLLRGFSMKTAGLSKVTLKVCKQDVTES